MKESKIKTNPIIVLAVRKVSDIDNLLSSLGISSSIKENFSQEIEYINTLINDGLIDNSIFNLMDYYDIYVACKNIKLTNLNKKYKALFENSISPEMLVGIELLLLLGINQKRCDFLISHPEYKDKFRKFTQSILSYIQDHQNYLYEV